MQNYRRPKVYFAAPLFNAIERDFNLRVAAVLGSYSDVFLPQRDGLLLKDLIAEGMDVDKARSRIYQRDIAAIENADILLAVLDGRTIDEGVAFELGYAKALGKSCIGLKTDDRILVPSGDNPMIVSGCQKICRELEEVILHVQAFVANSSDLYLRTA